MQVQKVCALFTKNWRLVFSHVVMVIVFIITWRMIWLALVAAMAAWVFVIVVLKFTKVL